MARRGCGKPLEVKDEEKPAGRVRNDTAVKSASAGSAKSSQNRSAVEHLSLVIVQMNLTEVLHRMKFKPRASPGPP